MRGVFAFLAAVAFLGAEADAGETSAPPARRALNRAFRGKILELKKRRVTLFYDFEDPAQLEDFEAARPPRLLDGGQNRAAVEGGRLVLSGSTSIRHRMEAAGRAGARFRVRAKERQNVGAVFTEPTLTDFYVVYNLFDQRFNRNGHMYIGACGLREDEGAEDLSSGLVNFRDIFSRDLGAKARTGEDLDVEVLKEGWNEFFRVQDVKGKGSSKGKTREMRAFHLGLFVHGTEASFDDLTITCDLSDAWLEYENLEARIEREPAEGPREAAATLARADLPAGAREAAAQRLRDRKDPKDVPLLLEALASGDAMARRLAIGIVKASLGDDFGFDADAPEAERAEALRRLRARLG